MGFSLRGCALLALASGELSSQTIPVRVGDTVRVWYPGLLISQQGQLTALARDTLTLGSQPVRIAGLQRIDVARGASVSRGKTAVLVGVGAVIGVGAAILTKDQACAGCDTIVSRFDIGMALGAGLGYLASRLVPKTPRWFTVWPADEAPRDVAAPLPDSARPVDPAEFPTLRHRELVRVWTSDAHVRRGRFAEMTQDRSGLLLIDGPGAVPLSSITAIEVGRTYTTRGAVIGAIGLGAPAALMTLALCAFGDCTGADIGLVVGGFTLVGFGTGALIGSQVTWELRFAR